MALASTYLMDPTVSIAYVTGTVTTTVDITDQVSGIEINLEASVLKRTTFGNSWDRNGRGLKRGTVKFEFYVDFDASGMFELFNLLFASHELATFEAAEAGGAGIEGAFVVSSMPTFAGKIDEYNVASLTFTLDGPPTITERT